MGAAPRELPQTVDFPFPRVTRTVVSPWPCSGLCVTQTDQGQGEGLGRPPGRWGVRSGPRPTAHPSRARGWSEDTRVEAPRAGTGGAAPSVLACRGRHLSAGDPLVASLPNAEWKHLSSSGCLSGLRFKHGDSVLGCSSGLPSGRRVSGCPALRLCGAGRDLRRGAPAHPNPAGSLEEGAEGPGANGGTQRWGALSPLGALCVL